MARSGVTRIGFVWLGMKKGLLTSGHSNPANQLWACAIGRDHGTYSEDQRLQKGGGIHRLKWGKSTLTKRPTNVVRRDLNW